MSNRSKQPDLHAFIVTGSEDQPFYTKIGAAWKNKVGGYGVRLEAFPTNGNLVLFPPRDKSQSETADR